MMDRTTVQGSRRQRPRTPGPSVLVTDWNAIKVLDVSGSSVSCADSTLPSGFRLACRSCSEGPTASPGGCGTPKCMQVLQATRGRRGLTTVAPGHSMRWQTQQVRIEWQACKRRSKRTSNETHGEMSSGRGQPKGRTRASVDRREQCPKFQVGHQSDESDEVGRRGRLVRRLTSKLVRAFPAGLVRQSSCCP